MLNISRHYFRLIIYHHHVSRHKIIGLESRFLVWYRCDTIQYRYRNHAILVSKVSLMLVPFGIVWPRCDTLQYRLRDHAILVSKVSFMLVSFGLGAIPYGIDIDTSIKSYRLCWYCLVPIVSFGIATRVIMRTSMLFL